MTWDEQLIYCFALRYVIGRQTYAPGIVIAQIRQHIKDFNKKSLKIMFEDLVRYEEAEERMNKRPEYKWTNLKEFLSKKLEES